MSTTTDRPDSPLRRGSFELFRAFGIRVFLHWTWFIAALYQVQSEGTYSRWEYKLFEVVAVFAIVLMHEFGHALACRSVGGQAFEIVLNPLGGYALVSPPLRPGAELWSIAAGPLVNVVLAPLLFIAMKIGESAQGLPKDAATFLDHLFVINLALAAFNLLPIFPLDGGRILRALLWFVVGPATSLGVAAWVGVAGCVGLLALAIGMQSVMLGVIAVFGLFACHGALKRARALRAWLATRAHDVGA